FIYSEFLLGYMNLLVEYNRKPAIGWLFSGLMIPQAGRFRQLFAAIPSNSKSEKQRYSLKEDESPHPRPSRYHPVDSILWTPLKGRRDFREMAYLGGTRAAQIGHFAGFPLPSGKGVGGWEKVHFRFGIVVMAQRPVNRALNHQNRYAKVGFIRRSS
ncbi:MAG: hypothetical protein R6W69_10880, partial [Anaerolineales bacterium]